MVNNRREIVALLKEDELLKEFASFEDSIETELAPLREALAKMPLSNDVPRLETHMTYVESWRERVARRLSLVICFTQHAKSHHFLLPKGKHVTSDDRTAYQYSLTATMKSLENYLGELIVCIDSRVNEVKKLTAVEYEAGGRRLNN